MLIFLRTEWVHIPTKLNNSPPPACEKLCKSWNVLAVSWVSLQSTTTDLGSTSNAMNICISSVEWIINVSTSSFRLLLCFCWVQFPKMWFIWWDWWSKRSSKWLHCILALPRNCFKAYFSPILGKLASAWVFCCLLKTLPKEQRNLIHYFAIK